MINGCLFEGEEVIHAEDLVPCDTDESAVVLTRGEKNVTIQRNRDILKMHIPEAGFVLIGVENQQKACQQLYRVQGDLSALKGIHLTRETAIAVGTVTGSRELIEMAESEGDEIDMCMALDNLIKEKVSEGKLEGKLEGKREGTLGTCISFFEQGMISISAAAQKCELTEAEFLREIEMRKAGVGSDGGVQS